METLVIAVLAGLGFIAAYHTYGRWLSRKIFRLDPHANVPSVALNDDRDYVPTKKSIIFGHHFTSIAGTGPIVGPAIAVIWGWLPALLWVLFGSILIGAVHDFGTLVVSMRNRGHTVGDIAGRVLNPRARLLFLLILFMALTIVLAIFGLVIAAVFRQYPSAIFPCVFQVPLAAAIGIWLHRKGIGLTLPSLAALALMYVSVIFGNVGWLGDLNAWMASWPTIVWVAALLAYSYVASVLPVWTLLQPRDYINSLQLLTALGLVLLGLVTAAIFGGSPVDGTRPELSIVAPMVEFSPEGAPMLIPFLFVTVACGAISGFHCLVSSGTSSKQLSCETDAQFVGYGSMLTEGFLATLVILACVAGLGLGIPGGEGGGTLMGEAAYEARYASWSAAGALAAKVAAFVDGSANFLRAMGVPLAAASALMGVLVASFAATTLDTATRLQRYVVQELAATCAAGDRGCGTAPSAASLNPLAWLRDRHAATIFAVGIAGLIAAFPAPGMGWSLETAGTGGLILWPLFGATNQLLAGLAFLVVAFHLWRRSTTVAFLVAPMLFMLLVPGVALAIQVPMWVASESPNWVVVFIGAATLALEIWMIVEAVLTAPRAKGVLEQALPPLRPAKTAAGDPDLGNAAAANTSPP